MTSQYYPLARSNELVVQELHREILIYDLKTDKAFRLNETAALVWKACDGRKNIGDIGALTGNCHSATISEDLVRLALDGLKKENLLANGAEISFDFRGISRRQLIRRIGFASAVALPLISSVIAPSSAHAASPVNPGGAAQGSLVTANAGFFGTSADCGAQLQSMCASGQVDPASYGEYSPCPGRVGRACTCHANCA